MTSEELKEKALLIFAEHGYEGASLSLIADQAGIKKQSIYSHYKSKDELFLKTVEDVFSRELVQAKKRLMENKPLKELLSSYLKDYLEKYEQDPATRFWLRMAFFPPAHLYDEVMIPVYRHLDTLEETLTELFERSSIQADPKEAALAYLGVLDSLFVEMLYGSKDRQVNRMNASFNIFWKGILKIKEE
ncbi:TetR family transcriptional regulator [Bacillus mangrovi]|uniref:TetR family transcriptional regulator n=1 Tax=Metabacillus mangrovi TaxID=1491830 RepID=A0A7X2S5F3_9BACI|nr:TetR/AcrR family transcriptional regulator [Metabacillus mangrovi]MTH53603.1 TetR family transcriptional regulator [Metabacillus mangrovi]